MFSRGEDAHAFQIFAILISDRKRGGEKKGETTLRLSRESKKARLRSFLFCQEMGGGVKGGGLVPSGCRKKMPSPIAWRALKKNGKGSDFVHGLESRGKKKKDSDST